MSPMVRIGDVQKLTPRQREILRLILNGFDAKSAARELGISVHTVNEHLTEARRHLGVSSSREAARILREAESTPPNYAGPNELGVVHPIRRRAWLRQLSLNRRLTYAGGALLILIAAAAIYLSIASGNFPSKHPNTPQTGISTRPGAAEQNPSPYQSRDVPAGRFDRLRVLGPFKVGVLISGEPGQVNLQGPPALLADTITSVEGDTLIVRFREGATWSWNPGSGVNVFVSAPTLTSVKVDGAAEVEVRGVRGDMLSAETDGSGTIILRGVDVGRVQLATGGSGGITVEGRARDGTYVVGGSGSIDAKRLRVESASIAIGGAGSAYADVSNAANISVNGSGRVEVVGGATCIKQPAHSRQVDCRR
jgi:DNA-binding CsgD family transcriptional regulator